MKQIVLPELRAYYRRLKETNQSQPGVLERECKLSGVPLSTNTTDLIERLVALQEYKIRKVLKSKLRSELQTLDEHSYKDIQMTQYLHQTIRKPLNMLDDTLKEDSLLNQEQRKSIVDKAIQDIIQDIVKIRSTYLKIQQSLMQIDEKFIDGKEIQDFELNLFEIINKIENIRKLFLQKQIQTALIYYLEIKLDLLSKKCNIKGLKMNDYSFQTLGYQLCIYIIQFILNFPNHFLFYELTLLYKYLLLVRKIQSLGFYSEMKSYLLQALFQSYILDF